MSKAFSQPSDPGKCIARSARTSPLLLREHAKGSSDGIVSQRRNLLKEIGDGRRYLQEKEE